MKKKINLFLTLILVIILTACSGGMAQTTTAAQSASSASAVESVTTTTTEAAQGIAAAESVTEALAENSEMHDAVEDYTWDTSAEIPIVLNGDSISAEAQGVTVDGSIVTITAAGTYTISGSLTDGQIIVDTEDKEIVRLILNGVNIANSTSAAINVATAKETIIVLAANTENTISDASSYVFASAEEDEPNAAIFAKSDLTITGNGSLTVNGNYNDGIASKDGLVIASGAIVVNAVDDGIRGKDYLVVKDGNITVNSQGDGLKSDNAEDTTKGYIAIEGGVINITSLSDAIQAETDVAILNGEINITAGGGSDNQTDETASAKGIAAGVNLTIDGGTITISSADDALHSNDNLTINGGTFNIASGDDGVHADATLNINNGSLSITDSYEGIESAVITINGGDINLVASDDGLNVAGGVDSSGMGGGPRGGGQDAFTSGNYYFYMNGGSLLIDARGDGIDVNGAIAMTGGVVIVNGPTENMNASLDYDGGFSITGGYLLAAGSSGMAQAPGESSTQNSVLINFDSSLQAGTLVHVENSAGEEIFTFAPAKGIQSIAFSSAELVNGNYIVYTGGSATGTNTGGLYQDGTYSGGSQLTSFTVSSVVTQVGNGGGWGGGRRR